MSVGLSPSSTTNAIQPDFKKDTDSATTGSSRLVRAKTSIIEGTEKRWQLEKKSLRFQIRCRSLKSLNDKAIQDEKLGIMNLYVGTPLALAAG